MHVSLHLSPQSRGPADDARIIESLVDTAVEAERHGIASVSLTEHHLAGFNTYVDPFIVGAHLAARLSTAYLSLTVVQMALHHPLKVVERINLLDNLTRGRLLVALAPGSASKTELGAFGADTFDRAQVTNERIDAVFRLLDWDGEGPGVDAGTSVDRGFVSGRINPASYRLPHALVGRATGTPATIEALGTQGIPAILGSWFTKDGDNRRNLEIYLDALSAAGHDEQTVEECLRWLGFAVPIIVAPTQADADRRWREYVEVGGEGPHPGRLGGAATWRDEWTAREVSRASGSLVGDPDHVVEQLLTISEAGARHIRLIPTLPAGRLEDRAEHLDLIFNEVLPRLSPEPLPAPSATRPLAAAAVR